MSNALHRLLASNASPAVLLIRLLVGAVFVSEGIQKFRKRSQGVKVISP
jgi:uncharacterized membrane protein YphA (DoxX/SURF4 family)